MKIENKIQKIKWYFKSFFSAPFPYKNMKINGKIKREEETLIYLGVNLWRNLILFMEHCVSMFGQ